MTEEENKFNNPEFSQDKANDLSREGSLENFKKPKFSFNRPKEKKDSLNDHKTGKRKLNHWKLATAVLTVILIIIIFSVKTSPSIDGSLTEGEAAAKTLSFINNNLLQGQAVARLTSVEENAGLYNVKLNINGQLVDGYVTKDGKYFFPQFIDMDEPRTTEPAQSEPTPAPEVAKSDKPVVELFVMSHCPYGTQAEKAMIPVVQELGDKIDFSIKFVNYAMHGEKEVLEQMNQVCIEKEQQAKFLDYLNCFLKEGEGETCLTEAKIDKTKLSSCVHKLDTEFSIRKNLEDQSTWSGGRFPLFLVHDSENKEYGVQGSPTLVINGQQASAARSPAGFLAAVCGAFSEVPDECGAELSSAQASPGFGFETTTGAATAASCG